MAKKTITATLPAPAPAPVREEEPLGTLNSFTTRSAEMVVTQADDAAHQQRLTQYYTRIAGEQAARRDKLDAERAERQWRAILDPTYHGNSARWETFDACIRSLYYAYEQAVERGNKHAAEDAREALMTFTAWLPLDWVELDRGGHHVVLHPALWKKDGRPPTIRVAMSIDTTDCLGHALLAADEQASAEMPKLDEES